MICISHEVLAVDGVGLVVEAGYGAAVSSVVLQTAVRSPHRRRAGYCRHLHYPRPLSSVHEEDVQRQRRLGAVTIDVDFKK
jgi:hypothetical protein